MAIKTVDKRDRDIYFGSAAERGTVAAAAVAAGSLWVDTDVLKLWVSTGAAWLDITTLASAGALAIGA